MAKNGKDTKYTRHITRRMHLVRNGKYWNFHKTIWSEGGLKLAFTETKNVREDKLNPILGYDMVTIDNKHNTCQIRNTCYRRVLRTMCSE